MFIFWSKPLVFAIVDLTHCGVYGVMIREFACDLRGRRFNSGRSTAR